MWDAIAALPVVSLLADLSVTATGGSPVVALTVPGFFGEGSHQLDLNFSEDEALGVDFETYFILLGDLMLAFCGIRWTIYLFQG